MNLIDALVQPRMMLAWAAFAALNALLMRMERGFLVAMSDTGLTAWLAEHVYLPLARVFAVLAFIALAYPALFALQEAPGLLELLHGGERRVSHLINLGFLLSLLLPLLPLFDRLPGLVLPAQALSAGAMLFEWLAQQRGIDAVLWPGWQVVAGITIWLVLAQRLAGYAAHLWTDPAQPDSSERERAFYQSALLFFQAPALLLYTAGLGQQLH